MFNRCGGACTGCCGRAGQVVCRGCGFAGLWRFPEDEAALGDHSAHSPAGVSVTSPGHAMGYCQVKYRHCSLWQVWRSLHRGLRQGWAGGLWGLRFCRCVEISRGGGSTRQPQRTDPWQCVSDQPWACHGVLQGSMQPLQCEAGVVGPVLLGGRCSRAGQVVCRD